MNSSAAHINAQKNTYLTRFFFSEAFPVRHWIRLLFVRLLMSFKTICGHDKYVQPFDSYQPLKFIVFFVEIIVTRNILLLTALDPKILSFVA